MMQKSNLIIRVRNVLTKTLPCVEVATLDNKLTNEINELLEDLKALEEKKEQHHVEPKRN